MFTRLIDEIEKSAEKDIEQKAKHIMDDENLARYYATEHRWDQYQSGEIDLETVKGYAASRMERQVFKDVKEKVDRAKRVYDAPRLENISIAVEFTKSHNAVATCDIYSEGKFERTQGRAGGYGYDKESSAIASALNASDSVLRELYEYKEQRLEAGESDAGRYSEIDNRDIIGYGAGYDVLPYFEGAVGSECYWRIFEMLGFEVHGNYAAKTANFYHVGRRGE